jgi:hypothetical protein
VGVLLLRLCAVVIADTSLTTQPAAAVAHRLGQLAQAGHVLDRAAAPQAQQQQLQDLLALSRARVGGMAPKQLAELVAGLSQLQLAPDVALLDALAAQCLSKLAGVWRARGVRLSVPGAEVACRVARGVC